MRFDLRNALADKTTLAALKPGKTVRFTIVEDGKKVTISCSPSHEFFAGRHAATVLTHNYTFTS